MGSYVLPLLPLSPRVAGSRIPEWTEKIESPEDVGFMTKQGLAGFASLLSMSDEQLDEYRALREELRDLLKSRLVEPIQA